MTDSADPSSYTGSAAAGALQSSEPQTAINSGPREHDILHISHRPPAEGFQPYCRSSGRMRSIADSATDDLMDVLSKSGEEPHMRSTAVSVAVFAACSALALSPVAHADRAEPVPIYGYYNAFLDHAHQTFNGMPTPSDSAT